MKFETPPQPDEIPSEEDVEEAFDTLLSVDKAEAEEDKKPIDYNKVRPLKTESVESNWKPEGEVDAEVLHAASQWAIRNGITYQNSADLKQKYGEAIHKGETVSSAGIGVKVESQEDVPDYFLMEDVPFEDWLMHTQRNTPPAEVNKMRESRKIYREGLEEKAA